ncbi:aspartate-alanine antiporter-like transporter [Escherichia coli]
MTLSSDMLHVIQEFGLILFVYTIGIQVGPGLLCLIARLRITPQPVCCSIVIMVVWLPPSCINCLIFHCR